MYDAKVHFWHASPAVWLIDFVAHHGCCVAPPLPPVLNLNLLSLQDIGVLPLKGCVFEEKVSPAELEGMCMCMWVCVSACVRACVRVCCCPYMHVLAVHFLIVTCFIMCFFPDQDGYEAEFEYTTPCCFVLLSSCAMWCSFNQKPLGRSHNFVQNQLWQWNCLSRFSSLYLIIWSSANWFFSKIMISTWSLFFFSLYLFASIGLVTILPLNMCSV